jgi:ribonuclease HIII
MQILSEKAGIELPKGASSQVIQIGKRLVNKQGENILRLVGKLHFKTKDSILHD